MKKYFLRSPSHILILLALSIIILAGCTTPSPTPTPISDTRVPYSKGPSSAPYINQPTTPLPTK